MNKILIIAVTFFVFQNLYAQEETTKENNTNIEIKNQLKEREENNKPIIKKRKNTLGVYYGLLGLSFRDKSFFPFVLFRPYYAHNLTSNSQLGLSIGINTIIERHLYGPPMLNLLYFYHINSFFIATSIGLGSNAIKLAKDKWETNDGTVLELHIGGKYDLTKSGLIKLGWVTGGGIFMKNIHYKYGKKNITYLILPSLVFNFNF